MMHHMMHHMMSCFILEGLRIWMCLMHVICSCIYSVLKSYANINLLLSLFHIDAVKYDDYVTKYNSYI